MLMLIIILLCNNTLGQKEKQKILSQSKKNSKKSDTCWQKIAKKVAKNEKF